MQNNNKTLIWVIGAILVIIIGATLYFSTRNSDTNGTGDNTQNGGQNEPIVAPNPGTISAKHSSSGGKHIIAGEVQVPTPCHFLIAKTVIAESFPEQVTIEFTTTSSGDEICAQVIDTRRFKVDFNASQNAMIKARWNGEPVTLKLTPAGSKELELFNVYIKA